MTKIKVVGIGGSGGNTVSRMVKSKIKDVELIALNTDFQDLKKTKAHIKIRIGKKTTQGLGSGMDPEVGKKAALESRQEISESLKGADIIFITFGAGGGTGTGAGPVVAEIAKNSGALTIAVVTKPFSFEGVFRQRIAEQGLRKLKEKVDSLLVVQNDRLLEIFEPNTSVTSAFWHCDDILREAVKGISDLLLLPGLINVDFADIKTIMENSGNAVFGFGQARGEKRAEQAARLSLGSPLLDVSCKGARGVLINISGSKDLALSEVEEVVKVITQEINPDSRVIFGAVYDEKIPKGEIKVTTIAAGF
jgi:cell division protein FtsZ